MAVPFQDGFPQFFDNSGNVLAGGKLYTYAAGTLTPLASYTTQAGNVSNANPVVLDSAGRASVWLDPTRAYRMILKTSDDTTLKDVDNIQILGDASTAPVVFATESQTMSAGQTVVTFSAFTYSTGVNALYVTVDGTEVTDYTETSSTSITFPIGFLGGETLRARTGRIVTSGFDGAMVSYQASGLNALATDVQTFMNAHTIPLARWLLDPVNASASDVDTAISRGVAHLATLGGGTLELPHGTLSVSATFGNAGNSRIRIKGQGRGQTIISPTGDYGDVVLFTGNDGTGATADGCGISNLTISASSSRTSGALIHGNGLTQFDCHEVTLLNGFISMRLDGVLASYVSGVYAVNTNLYGGSVSGRRYLECGTASTNYAHPHCGDLFFTDTNWRGNTANNCVEYGILIKSADGIWFENGHVGNTTLANIAFQNQTADYGGNLNLVWFTNFMSDEGLGQSLSFAGNTNSISGSIKFVSCIFKGALLSDYGLVTTSTAAFDSVSFTDCEFREQGLHGVFIQSPDCRRWTFTNCQVQGNGNDTTNTYSGYALASGVRDIQIVGGRAGGDNNDASSTGDQAYGINCIGTATNVQVIGVDLRGNLTGDISAPTTGVKVDNCLTDASTAVASATTVTLPALHDFITVTGTTTITSITASRSGRMVTLIFASSLTVNDGSNLSLDGNFSAGANDTLTLRCDGTTWHEISRSPN